MSGNKLLIWTLPGILFSCIPMIFLFSCSVLSESQLKNINTFATAAKNYSNFPGEVVKKSQELHYNNAVLEASAIPDSTQIIRALETAKAQYEKGITLSKKMDASLQLIQKYAALLAQLSSNSFADDLGKNAKELSRDLNSAVKLFNEQLSSQIPGTIGKGISEIITIIGDRVIKNKQAKALQKFIPVGDTLIQLTTYNLVSALDADLKPLIESYKSTFQIDFKTIIFDHSDRIDYNMLRFYINTNSDYADVELLRKKCIHAAEKMASSHKELKDNIIKKKNFTELLSETKDFVSDVKELNEALNKLFTKA
jgi:exonuclease VII small subunit